MHSLPHLLYQHIEHLFKKEDSRIEQRIYNTGEILYLFWPQHGTNGSTSVFAVNKDGLSGMRLGDKSLIPLPFPNDIKPKGLSPQEFECLQRLREDKLLSFIDEHPEP